MILFAAGFITCLLLLAAFVIYLHHLEAHCPECSHELEFDDTCVHCQNMEGIS